MWADFSLAKLTRRQLWFCYGAYLVFLVVAAFMSVGWQQPDEHTRVMEPAHYIAYGYATLTWEFRPEFPLVSFFLGAIHSWPLIFTKFLGLSGLTEASVLRAFSGVVCSTRLIAFYLILPMLGLSGRFRRWYLLIFALNVFGPMLFVRTSQLNWSTTALTWAFFFFLRLIAVFFKDALDPSEHPLLDWRALRGSRLAAMVLDGAGERAVRRYGFCLGIFLALSTSFRLQCGICAASLGLLAWWVIGFRRSLPIVAGILLGLMPMALVDGWFHGMPFKSAFNYLLYALGDEEGGQVWGTSPWYYYFLDYFAAWFPPLCLVLLPMLWIGLCRIPLFAVSFFPFLLAHTVLGHKETRYFMPMLPVMFWASFVGFERMRARWPRFFSVLGSRPAWRRTGWALLLLNIVVGIVAALLPLNTSPLMFTKVKELREQNLLPGKVLYVGDTNMPISQFYFKNPGVLYEQMQLSDFLRRSQHDPSFRFPDTLALYCISMDEIRQIETNTRCHITYLSAPAWYLNLASRMGNPRHSFRVHAIAQCSAHAS